MDKTPTIPAGNIRPTQFASHNKYRITPQTITKASAFSVPPAANTGKAKTIPNKATDPAARRPDDSSWYNLTAAHKHIPDHMSNNQNPIRPIKSGTRLLAKRVFPMASAALNIAMPINKIMLILVLPGNIFFEMPLSPIWFCLAISLIITRPPKAQVITNKIKRNGESVKPKAGFMKKDWWNIVPADGTCSIDSMT